MMKKLLAVVVLSLMISGNAYTETNAPIKHKRIECTYKDMPQRYNNHFLIISDDDKTAEIITIPWGQVEKYNANIKKDLLKIVFTFRGNLMEEQWELERKSGILKEYINNNFMLKRTCEPFSKDFNPEEFLNNAIKTNKKNLIKNNKF